MQSVAKLKQKGYERDKLWEGDGLIAFRKYGVVISLEFEPDNLLVYRINVVAPNIS